MFANRAAPAVAFAYSGFALVMALAVWVQPSGDEAGAAPGQMENKTFQNEALMVAEVAGDIAARPLFHISRRPYAAPVAEQIAPQIRTLRLLGILNSNETRIALLRFSNADRVYRVQKDDRIETWTILDITDEWVDLSEDGGSPVRLVFDTGQ